MFIGATPDYEMGWHDKYKKKQYLCISCQLILICFYIVYLLWNISFCVGINTGF